MAQSNFDVAKKELLGSLAHGVDYSPKGSIDIPVKQLIDFINSRRNYVTTSSCSGRISLYNNSDSRKGINWLLVSHGPVTREMFSNALANVKSSPNLVTMLKCEAFILHIHCRCLESARRLHHIAFSCGFRESGLAVGNKKVILAVRTSSFGLEMPIAIGSELISNDERCLEIIINEANDRLRRNFARIDKFLSMMKAEFVWPQLLPVSNCFSDSKVMSRWGHTCLNAEVMARPKHQQVLEKSESHQRNGWTGDDNVYVIGGYGLSGSDVDDASLSSKSSRNVQSLLLRETNLLRHEGETVTGFGTGVGTSAAAVAGGGCEGAHAAASTWTTGDRTFLLVTGGRRAPTSEGVLPILRVFDEQLRPVTTLFPSHPSNPSLGAPSDAPSPRWGHTLTPLGNGQFFLYGGRDDATVYGDAFILHCRPNTGVDGAQGDECALQCEWEKVFDSLECAHPAGLQQNLSKMKQDRAEDSDGNGDDDVPLGAKAALTTCCGDTRSLGRPVPRFFHAAVAVNTFSAEGAEVDAVLIHGGLLGLGDPPRTCGHFVLVRLPSPPSPRSGSLSTPSHPWDPHPEGHEGGGGAKQATDEGDSGGPAKRSPQAVHWQFVHATTHQPQKRKSPPTPKGPQRPSSYPSPNSGSFDSASPVVESENAARASLGGKSEGGGEIESLPQIHGIGDDDGPLVARHLMVPRFGHTLTDIGARSLLLVGGAAFGTSGSGSCGDLATGEEGRGRGRGAPVVLDLRLRDDGGLALSARLAPLGASDLLEKEAEENVASRVSDAEALDPAAVDADVEAVGVSEGCGVRCLPCEECRVHHQAIVSRAFADGDSSVTKGAGDGGRPKPRSSLAEAVHLLGGGAHCLAFGPHYCDSLSLLVGDGDGDGDGDGWSRGGNGQFRASENVRQGGKVRSQDKGQQQRAGPNDASAPTPAAMAKVALSTVIFVPAVHVKATKVLLEANGLMDKSRRISTPDMSMDRVRTLHVRLDTEISSSPSSPLTAVIWTIASGDFQPSTSDKVMSVPIADALADALDRIYSSIMSTPSLEWRTAGASANDTDAKAVSVLAELASGLQARISYGAQEVRLSKALVVSSYRRAHEWLEAFVQRQHPRLPPAAAQAFPKKFEVVGDVLMVPEDALRGPSTGWDDFLIYPTERNDEVGQQDAKATVGAGTGSANKLRRTVEFWSGLASCFGLTRVAQKARIGNGPKRESKVRLLLPLVGRPATTGPGSDGWVQVTENGLTFGFDITRVMFCSGNVTERMRMARQPVKGQTIVDLYCGVGYYTLPFLVHGGAEHVHACEWNPNSTLSLRHNLGLAGVQDRCSVYEGDNRITAPTLDGLADRVCLGLLPSSVSGWPLAAIALKPRGGVLHVHENVAEAEIDEWVGACCGHFEELLAAAAKPMRVECVHLERVKSYAPRVIHIVADLACSPVTPT